MGQSISHRCPVPAGSLSWEPFEDRAHVGHGDGSRPFQPNSSRQPATCNARGISSALLHFNTLFTLPTKGITNVFVSAIHPGFRCSIKKRKSSKSSCKHQCFATLSSCPVGVATANRNCKQRPNGNESGRQKGVKTK